MSATALPPAIFVLAERALPLARRAQEALPGSFVLGPAGSGADRAYQDLGEELRHLFARGHGIVGICAAAVLIRKLAPALGDKSQEPPVVALDEAGLHAVPLLGGHRGANRTALALSKALGAAAAVTTASDARFGLSLDDPPAGWVLANPEHHKAFAAALLNGARVRSRDETGHAAWIKASSLPLDAEGALTLRCTLQPDAGAPDRLVYHPLQVTVGVGCERCCAPEELRGLVQASLDEAKVSPRAVAAVHSLDLKSDEPAVHALAAWLGVRASFFARDQLAAEDGNLATPSEAVAREVGLRGVAEAAALAGARALLEGAAPQGANTTAYDQPTLMLAKRKSQRATCALGLAPWPGWRPATRSRPRGRLRVAGLGPGGAPWRTAETEQALLACEEAVGYGLYLDLAADLLRSKTLHRYDLGEETERCAFALRRAAEGRDVALVCSGDPGVYAMAALVEELVEASADPATRRVLVEILPGVSAFQLAAARAGAPIGHDFCCVSLSDLLTPLDVIEQRLEAAASGDFVVALYNPVSKRRRHALPLAREIMLRHRPNSTPVLIARNLGRADETTHTTTLEKLSADEVDMLTLVLIGSSTTRAYTLPDGRTRLVTPRGYAGKGSLRER